MSALDAHVEWHVPDFTLHADLSLGPGVTGLFGPSGAGKSTLLGCLAGLVRPHAGRIVRGKDVLFDAAARIDVPPEHRRVGVVFQEMRLFPHLTVRENLLYGWRRAGGSGGRIVDSARVHEVLELGALLERRPASLSGGEARRVAFGRSLLADPDVLLLDEPLAGLDEARKGAVLDLVTAVQAEFHLPILFVSHSLSDLLQLTTQVVVMEGGRTIGAGELHDVLGEERVFRLAEALGLESVLPVEILGSDPVAGLTRARLGRGEIALPLVERPPGTRALVAVRPEDVILARAPVEGTSLRNALRGTVTSVTRLSDRLLVAVDVGATLRAEVSAGAGQELGLAVGAPIFCLVKAFSFRWRRFVDRRG